MKAVSADGTLPKAWKSRSLPGLLLLLLFKFAFIKRYLMFSIVIPVFNEAQNIEALVNEIFNSLKDYNDFEVILVNDSSTDNTIDLVCALKKKI